jgi:hypothetical protein
MGLINAFLGNGSIKTFQHIYAVNNTVENFLSGPGHAAVEELCFLHGPCHFYITGVCCVEAGSNTSTVTLRVVEGD